MSNTILLKDNVVAFTLYPQSDAQQVNEWSEQAQWTNYGYVVPFDYDSAQIIEFLDVGPEKFIVPFRPDSSAGPAKEFNPQALIITRDTKVYHLRLIYSGPDKKHNPALSIKRVFHGPGAKYVVSDGLAEHDRAFLSMKLTNTMEAALDIFERNTSATQFRYKLANIDEVAERLRRMWQRPLHKVVTIKPTTTVEIKPNFTE